MSSLIGKVKKILSQKSGELLMEAIVSILLFSILMVTVTTMIQTSRNVTATSMQEATAFQEGRLNLAVIVSDDLNLVQGVITFTSVSADLHSEHDIRFYDNEDFIVAIFPGAD
jgi:hypothetical protein